MVRRRWAPSDPRGMLMNRIHFLVALVLGVVTRDAVGRVETLWEDEPRVSSCGNGVCEASESCSTCSSDCGDWVSHGTILECPGARLSATTE